MNGEHQSEWVWPNRNGPSDAEKAAELSENASKASHGEAVIVNGSTDDNDIGNVVSGMQNGGMAALDSDSKLTSTYADVECIIEDLSSGKHTISNKLSIHKKALPKLNCEPPPSKFPEVNLSPIIEASYNDIKPPSSPLLTALRDAVSSVHRMDDFEIIQEIGEGFYAKVYKVM